MFSVTCLGRNGLYPTKNHPTSGYLIKCGSTGILVDLGSGVFASLLEKTPPEDLDAVVISHFHGDHSADTAVFGYYLASKGKKLKLYAPETGERLVAPLAGFKYETIADGDVITINDVKLSFFKTVHPVYCLGVKVVYNGKSLVYSADTNVCEALDKALVGADLAILDSAFTSAEYSLNRPHLSSALCAEYAKRHNVRTLLSHLSPTGDYDTLMKEADKVCDLCELIELKEYFI